MEGQGQERDKATLSTFAKVFILYRAFYGTLSAAGQTSLNPKPMFRLSRSLHPFDVTAVLIPRWLGSDPLSARWLGLAPATLEFWFRFPNERNQENRRTL